MNEEKKSQKVFVALTMMNGEDLDEALWGVYEADDIEAVRKEIAKELAEESPMSEREIQKAVEHDFCIEEMTITKVKGGEKR